ncbi:phage holin, LLH family [Enterococcus wangshanyuanii]|uniref:Uncharacterized protein n=1 Tax=Enterococcus wangshanyuanii TaxID=2005703 RepID=A0ABQ1PQU5_9ENTE|nr:phage holin, LLH family [Enterococcus wangshanyuanii]GGD01486.1 hypothetical protein GCM10011573_33860 [Enterococcus wangshanyuanii]
MSKEIVKNEVVKVVAEMAKREVPNEVKKRTAVATINRFLNENKDLSLSDKEIDDLIEEVVSDGSE